MSTALLRKTGKSPFFVIVMGYGYKPVKLKCLFDEKGAPKVASNKNEEWIGYPKQYIFEYNKTLFENLRAAYSKEDMSSLDCLWRKATPLLKSMKLISF